MKNSTGLVLSLVAACLVGYQHSAAAQTKSVSLWSGQLSLTVPSTAGKKKKISANLYSIRPTTKKSKIVLYGSREPVLADEKALSNAQLAASLKTLLEAQGYTVTSLTSKQNVFSAKLTAYASMPWRKVGSSAVRGMAKFVRTNRGKLIGAIILSDPKEWNKKTTRRYRSAVTKLKAS
jgi:hypothetical protein